MANKINPRDRSKRKEKNKTWILWGSGIAVLVIIFVVLAILLQRQSADMGKGEAELASGTPAPAFTLQSTQGSISLSDYKGKNVVLFFYEGNGCQPCVDQLIGLNKKVAGYGKNKTVILGITTDPVKLSKQVVQENNIQIPVLYDANQKVGRQFKVTDVPGGMDMGPVDTHSIFVIDQNGIVRWKQISPQKMYVPLDDVDKELQKLWQ